MAGLRELVRTRFSLVLLLVWVYYSAQIFLLGAEFARLYPHEHGSRTIGTALALGTAASIGLSRWLK